MTPDILFFIALFVFCILYLGWPLMQKDADDSPEKISHAGEDLRLRQWEVEQSLKELEFDHNLKKISDEDFKVVYQEALQEGSKMIDSLEKGKKS